MMQSHETGPETSSIAAGALCFAAFGSLSLYQGLSAMHRPDVFGCTALGVIFAALAFPAATLLRNALKMGGACTSPAAVQRMLALGRVNKLQWAAIAGAIVMLGVIRKQEFLSPVITFIVGLHLFPLARLLHYPPYRVTGTMLVLWANAVVCALPGSALPSVATLGTAVILLGSAAYTLASVNRAARSGSNPGRLFPAKV